MNNWRKIFSWRDIYVNESVGTEVISFDTPFEGTATIQVRGTIEKVRVPTAGPDGLAQVTVRLSYTQADSDLMQRDITEGIKNAVREALPEQYKVAANISSGGRELSIGLPLAFDSKEYEW